MDDLSGILVYEAMRTAKAHAFEVRTPLGPTTGTRLSNPPLVVPVLRAGLGMLGGILRYLPETDTGFIGLARNEETYLPASSMNSVPEELGGSSDERRVGKECVSTCRSQGVPDHKQTKQKKQ